MRCSESGAYSLLGYCSTTVLKAAYALRAVLGGRCVVSARNNRSIALGWRSNSTRPFTYQA